MANHDTSRRSNAPVMNDSLAYDLSRQGQAAQRYSTAPKQKPQARPEPQARPTARPAFRVMAVKPAAIVMLALALFIGVCAYRLHAQIIQVNRDLYRLELRTVTEAQDELEIRYESAFNFTQLEDYAVRTLGMQRPRDEQIYYLTSSAEDHAVAVAERNSSHGLVDRLGDFFSELWSYFR